MFLLIGIDYRLNQTKEIDMSDLGKCPVMHGGNTKANANTSNMA
jgi:hypothetical protein